MSSAPHGFTGQTIIRSFEADFGAIFSNIVAKYGSVFNLILKNKSVVLPVAAIHGQILTTGYKISGRWPR